MRISYGISDVCSSDLRRLLPVSDGGPGDIGQFAAIGQMVDPPHPLEAESYLAAPLPAADEPPRQSRLGAILKLGLGSEEHTSELQSRMRISYAVLCS